MRVLSLGGSVTLRLRSVAGLSERRLVAVLFED